MESIQPMFQGVVDKDISKDDNTAVSFDVFDANDNDAITIKAMPKQEVIPQEKYIAEVAHQDETIIHKLPKIQTKEREVTLAAKEQSRFKEVKVKKGDSLDKLAKIHGSTVAEIKRINKLNDSFLRIGQNLLLPIKDKANVKSVETKSSGDAQYYVVKRGDNPWTIAIKHDMKVSDLLRLNNLNKEKAKRLRPGDKLRIR
jgi:peptidoglycan DL-endopeptidase LytF